MADNILFTERQRFKQWWLWLLFLVVCSVPLYGVLLELQNPQPFTDPQKNIGIVVFAVIFSAIIALFFLMRLETRITDKNIAIRFYPFHTSFQEYKWEDMAEVYLRQYSPLSEYGGWGIRYGMGRAGKAYNVSGSMGLQLVFKNGKKILIGTNKLAEMDKVLKRIPAASAKARG